MIYAIAKMSVKNPEALAQYRDVAGAALEKHGGKVATATGEFTALEGEPEMPNMAALLSFPDKEAAMAWINDPDIADVHDLRRRGGESSILLLG
ncbi:hypothetical protein shim_25950 [Shimia sp. SK013]|uniref:DUF1330 domain-containing protein n=1 Tax=Shimia sp. SK013 TaxID=1389006 RepID=UPI0006B5D5AD|nr:DUF1330 domain-containing protein [Shimia sp. SK013]KPA21130.1 hypothetical protein shim_25950 [Shimia sp. SK013]